MGKELVKLATRRRRRRGKRAASFMYNKPNIAPRPATIDWNMSNCRNDAGLYTMYFSQLKSDKISTTDMMHMTLATMLEESAVLQ